MSLRFHNTLSRELEPFQPLVPGRVGLYTCGPTVYNFAHIGNLRAYMFEDLLRRHLRHRGFAVRHVMNFTDVDDKTIAASAREGVPLDAYTRRYKEAFLADIDALNILRADVYPAATEHIPEMIALIRTLIEKGYAYLAADGSVYYSIDKFPRYGCLFRLDRAGMKAGARVAQDEYDKENVADFALWKAWDEKDGAVGWDSPWGRGRPGWHIECSAMSMKHLGETFDIHCGGVDNIFPHHDDEIAQSEAATGKPFARYWLHCAHLIVDGKKMAKSLGNFFTLHDLLDRGHTGREVRYVLLSTHYRQSLNFTFESLAAARQALARLDELRARLAERAGPAAADLPAWGAEARRLFGEALDDDLNISGALAALFDLVRAANRDLDAGALGPGPARAVLGLLDEFDGVLGFLAPPREEEDPEIVELARLRQAARAAKNWAESDRLRDLLAARGWVVQDTPQGPKLKRKS